MTLSTKRPVSPGAEGMIGVVHRVLDHGEVELVDYMGTDESIVKVARVSTGSERQDLGLLGYLVRHRHTSPIEFGRLTLRVKLPIFVARQWIRHRTGSFSERSLRYQPPLDEAYMPAPEFVQGKPTQNKQGRGGNLRSGHVEGVRGLIGCENAHALCTYQALATPYTGTDKRDDIGVYPHQTAGEYGQGIPVDTDETFPGVAPELARSVLPLGTYTEWYWTTDAHNLMHWLSLRLDHHAQAEIRTYGEVVMRVFEAWLPALAAAFRRYRLRSVTLSEAEVAALGRILRETDGIGDAATDGLGMSIGELLEFVAKVKQMESCDPHPPEVAV